MAGCGMGSGSVAAPSSVVSAAAATRPFALSGAAPSGSAPGPLPDDTGSPRAAVVAGSPAGPALTGAAGALASVRTADRGGGPEDAAAGRTGSRGGTKGAILPPAAGTADAGPIAASSAVS